MGPQTKAADALHGLKYRGEGEDFREAMNRVAFALKDNDDHYKEFRQILLEQRFSPGGRIQNAMGATRRTTPYNCYVSGTIEDSFVDGPGSIMARATEAAATMRMGGGIGYDFSTLRPKGDLIKKLQSQSSGPLSFMEIYNAVCLATASSGHRRGAQMGVLRVDHPDIEEFIHAKQNNGKLNGFNISIAVTDEFMEAALKGKDFDLRFGGRSYRTIDAAALWEMIMRSTWDWAEPGVLFIDQINRMNNLWYCETIAATNPCGEQPLPPYGACLLGSVNLVKYLVKTTTGYWFDFNQLRADMPHVVRAMDNVVDRALYPLPQQKGEAITKRRMGIGVMALANAGEALGLPYGSRLFIEFENHVMSTIKEECYKASALLAKEKGAFPLYDENKYLQGEFIKTLDGEVRDMIKRYGIRNSHLTSIAPTGTISLCCDNVSSGIEPVFSHEVTRPINTPDGQMIQTVKDYGVEFLGVKGVTCDQVTADQHVAVLINAQKHVDSAVSKTCNVDGKMSWEDFKGIYQKVWEGGGKGATTFNKDGKRMTLLTAEIKDESEAATCRIDLETGRRECA